MGLNQTPGAERLYIGIFGRRNAGKSSVINALTGQDLAIVSDTKGTTTDPVQKSMELLPLGPVVMIDTPGIDDVGALGQERIRRAYRVLNKTDIALLVVDAEQGMSPEDEALLKRIEEKSIPYLIVYNKADLAGAPVTDERSIAVSATTGAGIFELKERIGKLVPEENQDRYLVRDLLQQGDVVILVVPIDASAPKGRLILPQQQVIRDILEAGAQALVVQDDQLESALTALCAPPRLVVTDSQVFGKVSKIVPAEVPLTSFSILMARYKGNLQPFLAGLHAIETLKDGDTILISEACTHHRQCEDIGTVKIPRWLESFTQKKIHFETSSGTDFPLDLTPYHMILHCGGCMITEREMQYRLRCAADQNVPIINYGMAIAYMNGILKRSLEPFSDLKELL